MDNDEFLWIYLVILYFRWMLWEYVGMIIWFFHQPFGSVSKPCTPVVHIKIAGKWMFIPLKMVLIGIDPYPFDDLMGIWSTFQ